MDEFEFIRTSLRPLAPHPGAHGLSDDGATLPPPASGMEWRITTDVLIEGVHFRQSDPIETIAHKALGVNVSDLLAQSAVPKFYFLTFTLPPQTDLKGLVKGVARAQNYFGISLLGGDTTRTPGPLTIGVTAIGEGRINGNPLRSRAQPGDSIGLILGEHGPLGAAKAGFEGVEAFLPAYLTPKPRVDLAGDLRNSEISAMADVSDGLLQDLAHIATASQIGAEVELSALPIALSAEPALPQITWGDDYALVLTAKTLPQIEGLITIGKMTAGAGVKLLDGQGREIQVEHPGFVHTALS